MMRGAIAAAGLGLALLLAGLSGAKADDPKPHSALDMWIDDGDSSDSRKDVDEVSRALPPTGPSTPVPYCGPSALECP